MSLNEFLYFNKKKIILGFLSIVIIGGCFIYYYFYQKEEVNLDNNINLKVEEVKKEEKKEEVISEKCYFDIKGEVKNPGVYSIECDKRIIEKTTTNMIQKINPIFTVNPLISKEI